MLEFLKNRNRHANVQIFKPQKFHLPKNSLPTFCIISKGLGSEPGRLGSPVLKAQSHHSSKSRKICGKYYGIFS